MNASTSPFAFPEGETVALPATYKYEGATKSTENFFADTNTTTLLVLKNGVVRHERLKTAKARWLTAARGSDEVATMPRVKAALDQSGVLNPGVVLNT